MKVKYFLFPILIVIGIAAAGQKSNAQTQARIRVIIDNDFGGDPDGLFQLAHALLSPSLDIRAVIGSHLPLKDGFNPSDRQAEKAVSKAKTLIKLINAPTDIPVLTGSNKSIPDETTGVQDEAVKFIIQEAMRTDTKSPLYILCGAGLTEVASALLEKPEITEKLTLVWIGGSEYPGIALPPPGASHKEYNLNIDLSAVKVIFNHSTVNIWQVPRDAYRQCLVSFAQLQLHVKPKGAAGNYLCEQLQGVTNHMHKAAETYVLGDSPLVLLTALQSYFEPDPSSSIYVFRKAPLITDDGQYEENPAGRPIRVYTKLDTRLMFNDFFDKLELMKK